MQEALRSIPRVDELASHPKLSIIPRTVALDLIRNHLELLRKRIVDGEVDRVDIDPIIDEVLESYQRQNAPSIIPLINATGVVVHTNLGRSVLDKTLVDEIAPLLTNYSNLEFEISSGKRGSRYTHLSDLMKSALGCEDVLVVNNNAAAVFLILNTFANGMEAVVSRGELVEIGGSFRIPDVMRSSGATLREVGTTNKTHLKDYSNAINEKTAILMKVHRSNFSLKGFTSEASIEEIVELAKEHKLIDYFDLGSGQMVDLKVGDEPLLSDLAKLNPSLVSFSGDKLFGGVQAGIIFGKNDLIDKLKKNQLLRMLRVDKLTLTALEATLRRYQMGKIDEIPTVRMIRSTQAELENRAQRLYAMIGSSPITIEKTANYVGGGALPEQEICGIALAICGDTRRMQDGLRKRGIVARSEGGRLFVEVRTIFDEDLETIAQAVREVVQ